MLSVLKETKDYIVVNKPSGLITESNPYEDSLEDQVYTYLSKTQTKVFLGVVHRLDRVTSGVVLMAKKKSALQYFNRLFEQKDIQKTYLAITNKPVDKPKSNLVHFLKRDVKQKKALLFNSVDKGLKRCELKYSRMGVSGELSLLKISPKTGRFHQIRAQLSFCKMPIYGDGHYGNTETYKPLSVCLHAFALEYVDFNSDEKVVIMAPPANDELWGSFQKLIDFHLKA